MEKDDLAEACVIPLSMGYCVKHINLAVVEDDDEEEDDKDDGEREEEDNESEGDADTGDDYSDDYEGLLLIKGILDSFLHFLSFLNI